MTVMIVNIDLLQEIFVIDMLRARCKHVLRPLQLYGDQVLSLHIVVTIAEHASDDAPKRILKLSTYRLQIFLVKYECLWSLQLCEDQHKRGKLKKRVRKHVPAILTTYYIETRLNL